MPTVSVAVHNNRVYVANAGNRGSNYTGLRLRHDDRLTPVAGSTVALAEGSQPGDMLFNAKWHQAGGDPYRHVTDRQLHRRR